MKKAKINNKFLFFMAMVNIPIAGVLWLAAPHYGAMASVMVLMAITFSCQFSENWGDVVARSIAFCLKKGHIPLNIIIFAWFIHDFMKNGSITIGPIGFGIWVSACLIHAGIKTKENFSKKMAE
ncbi:MAG: hypothetical protein R3Y63_12850 [Eubacteriales bacterium]